MNGRVVVSVATSKLLAWRSALVAAFFLVSCGIFEGPTNPVIDSSDRLLTITRSGGVAGSPAADTSRVRSGEAISYSFTPKPSYQNVRVFIDGVAAPLSGSIAMDADHVMTVMADRIVEVPAALSSAVEASTAAAAQLKNPAIKPMDAYRAIVATTADLANRVPLDSLERYLRVARLKAYAPADAEKVARSLLEIRDSLHAAQASPAIAASDQTGETEVTYVFVNGIDTDATAFETTRRLLRATLSEAHLSDESQYAVENFYNPTGNADDNRALSFFVCARLVADAVAEGQNPSPNETCEAIAMLVSGRSDKIEAMTQVLTRVLYPDRQAVTPTAAALTDRIASLLGSSRVVVVAHSQGNLFLDEAYRELARRNSSNGRCIGTVSLAPPLPITRVPGARAVSASFVAGRRVKDVLLYLGEISPGLFPGMSSIPSNANRLTTALDDAYEVLTNVWLNILTVGQSALIAFNVQVFGGIHLHGVNEDYLTANRLTTASLLRAQTDNVLKECAASLEFSSGPESVVTGAPLDFDVHVLGPNGSLASKASVSVTVAIGANPGSAHLSGTVTVQSVDGVARFRGLTLNQPGNGYTLIASTPGAPDKTSATFNVSSSSVGFTGLVLGVSDDGISTSPLANAMVEIKRGLSSVLTTNTESDGSYSATDLAGGTYTVTASKAGYTTATIFDAATPASGSLTLPNILLVPHSPTPGAISGRILHAQTNQPLAGATVHLRSGINASAGTPIASTTSSAEGAYSFGNVSAGTYTVSAAGTGFVSNIRTGISVGGGRTVTDQNVSLSPDSPGGTFRVVLTWGATPRDLDSHLTGPLGSGRFHVYYANKGSASGSPFAELDVDDVTSFGPETITITNLGLGTYRYSVHDFSNAASSSGSALAASGAEVKLYEGSTLKAHYFVPNAPGTLWTVFEFRNGVVTPVNTMSFQSQSGAVPRISRRTCALAASDAGCIGNAATSYAKPPLQ